MGILLEKMEKICRTLSFQFMPIRITIFMLGDVWNNEDISMSDIIREVCIFKPNCLQDELEIADTLLSDVQSSLIWSASTLPIRSGYWILRLVSAGLRMEA